MRDSQGQMLLITILVLTVATTIALALIGRSTQDTSMTNQLEDSSRAFSAAEAGIEQALQSGVGTSSPQILSQGSGVTYSVVVSTLGGQTGVYQMLRKTPIGVTETLWLVEHNDDGSIDETRSFASDTPFAICWSSEAITPALIVSVLYKEGTDGSYKTARFSLDPDAAIRSNNFDSSNITTVNGCGLSNYYEKSFLLSSLGLTVSGVSADILLEMRIRPEYAATNIAINPGLVALPKQGKLLQSVGSTGSGVSRKVVVYQQYRTAGSIFDNVIYSQSSFSK